MYPLIPEKTRVLKNDVGAYVVPNPTTDHPSMFFLFSLIFEPDDEQATVVI